MPQYLQYDNTPIPQYFNISILKSSNTPTPPHPNTSQTSYFLLLSSQGTHVVLLTQPQSNLDPILPHWSPEPDAETEGSRGSGTGLEVTRYMPHYLRTHLIP